MPNIENISVRTNTLKPNGILRGSLSNNNGVLSGFSTNSFFEIPNGRQADATYVVKFTTPSVIPSSGGQDILHIENWDCFELTSGELNTYSWGAVANTVLLSNPIANTTYWIKSIHNGTTKTYYLSTDGETYNQVASITDSGMIINFDSPSTMGNISISRMQDERPFAGTIDLNGCYMEVGGNVVWRGMDYNNIQRVGGDEFDGQWVYGSSTVGSSASLAVGEKITWSVANLLPNDGYDYEVLFENGATTGATSGNFFELFLYPASSDTGIMARTARAVTRFNATQQATSTIVLPVKASDRNITIKNNSGAGTATGVGCWIRGYRRIGKNDTHSDYISSISTDESYLIAGNFLDGVWTYCSDTVFNGSLNSGATSNISLNSLLPSDGYLYECLLSTTAHTLTTNGNSVTVRLGVKSDFNNAVVCRKITRTNAQMNCAGNTLVAPVTNHNIYIRNDGSNSGPITVYLRGYRRVGTND